jgi:hypothetical protein
LPSSPHWAPITVTLAMDTIPPPAGDDQPPFDRGSADGVDQLWRTAEPGAAGV